MIFVTVGTHEQQFNRLIKEIDDLVGKGLIDEPVLIQTGYSTYKPRYCKYMQFIPSSKMQEYMKQASIVITHGGPSSFIEAMATGKKPIVVPRQSQYGEHINNHQVDFVKAVEQQHNILPVYDISNLQKAIKKSHSDFDVETKFKSHNAEFCNTLQALLKEL